MPGQGGGGDEDLAEVPHPPAPLGGEGTRTAIPCPLATAPHSDPRGAPGAGQETRALPHLTTAPCWTVAVPGTAESANALTKSRENFGLLPGTGGEVSREREWQRGEAAPGPPRSVAPSVFPPPQPRPAGAAPARPAPPRAAMEANPPKRKETRKSLRIKVISMGNAEVGKVRRCHWRASGGGQANYPMGSRMQAAALIERSRIGGCAGWREPIRGRSCRVVRGGWLGRVDD